MRKAGFGKEKEERKGPYEEYVDKYVRINYAGNDWSMGKVNNIQDGQLKLLPFVQAEHNIRLGQLWSLSYESPGESIPVSDVNGIRPISKENILNYCTNQNTTNATRFIQNNK